VATLEVYRRLAVPEVWLWKDGRQQLFALRSDGTYEVVTRSSFLPDLDLDLMRSFLDQPTAIAAMRSFRDALRARR